MNTPDAEARRERLVDIAFDLVVEQGIEALTMKRFADRCGLSRPALYQYFGSREHVLGELFVNDIADLSNELDSLLAAELDPMERIRLWLHFSLTHLVSPNHQAIREISQAVIPDELRGVVRALHGHVLTSLLSGLSELGVADPIPLAHLIFGAVSSAAGRIIDGASFVHEARALEEFVTAGVAHAVPDAKKSVLTPE